MARGSKIGFQAPLTIPHTTPTGRSRLTACNATTNEDISP